MSSFLLGITIFIALLTVAGLYRVAVGKTIFDRIIAAGLVGTNGFILLILVPIGVLFGGTIINAISRQSPQGKRKWRRQQVAHRLEKRWGKDRTKRALGL